MGSAVRFDLFVAGTSLGWHEFGRLASLDHLVRGRFDLFVAGAPLGWHGFGRVFASLVLLMGSRFDLFLSQAPLWGLAVSAGFFH